MPELPHIGPELLGLPSLRDALARRDISQVYRVLVREGIPQRHIAAAVGQSQSEVSEILSGRVVMAYDVLVRICTGLGVPRGYMGLGYSENLDIETEPELLPGEVTENMRRRALLAAGSIALLGAPVLGEVLEIPHRPNTPTPLPSGLTKTDVTALQNLTKTLRDTARTYGGGADVVTGVANRSLPLMSVSASDEIKSQLSSALAQLHTMAGWCCVDSGYRDNARNHFAKAMELAKFANDRDELASAWRHAGIQMIDTEAYDDGLKAYQMGIIASANSSENNHAWLNGESAIPLATMGHTEAAIKAISTAREYQLSDPFEAADMDFLTACVYRRLNRLDIASEFAISSVRKWKIEGKAQRDSAGATTLLAELHVETGQPDAISLANQSIEAVASLQSTRAAMRLGRLAHALDARSGSDYRDLARRARQVAFLT